jgi:hypothetical protein
VTAANQGLDVPETDRAVRLMRRADIWLVLTAALAGTWAFGLLALPSAVVTCAYFYRAARTGPFHRPWAVTAVGAFVLVDASMNFVSWGSDVLWAHNTTLIETMWTGYGRLVDGAYSSGYNTGPLGGVSNPSEKMVEVAGVLVLYPLRIASAWGFLRMKRWGLQGLVVTSYMYITFWSMYVIGLILDYDTRLASSEFGYLGMGLVPLSFVMPFLILRYLYTVDRSLFTEGTSPEASS